MDFSRFDYGVLHEDQRARLGIGITDINGERWGYIRIREAMSAGHIVRASTTADLGAANPIVVTAASPIGSDKITTTDGFVVSNVTQDLRGCLGWISAGGGIGQQFYILENDDDTAKVFVLTGNTNRNKNHGFPVALDTDSRVTLLFPGEGRQSDGLSDIVQGVMMETATADDIGKFCWVKRSGLAPIRVDASGMDLALGGIVVAADNGLAVGHDTAARGIGRALAPSTNIQDAEDYIAFVHLDIPDSPLSYAYANTQNGYNLVTVR